MSHRIIHPPYTPYSPGDQIEVTAPGADAVLLPVERCVPLITPGRWRVTSRRPDGKLHDVTVDSDGNDPHGYASRPKAGAR